MIEFFSKNLSNIWVSGEYETKLSVQKLLFPKGIVIDPNHRTCRTSNLNPIAASNIVLACYYCNNDKSNTIEPEIFKKFFGKQKSTSYKNLMEEKNIKSEGLYWHHL